MKEIYPFVILLSIFSLGLTAFFLFLARRAKAYQKMQSLAFAFGCGVWGVGLIAACILDSAKVFAVTLSFPIGCLLVQIPFFTLIRRKKCTVCVKATFSDIQIHRSRRYKTYSPVFSYTYGGEIFKSPSFIGYSKRELNRLFEKKKTYDIAINPLDPTDCVDKRKIPAGDIFCFVAGVLFLIFSIYLLTLPGSAIAIKSL